MNVSLASPVPPSAAGNGDVALVGGLRGLGGVAALTCRVLIHRVAFVLIGAASAVCQPALQSAAADGRDAPDDRRSLVLEE